MNSTTTYEPLGNSYQQQIDEVRTHITPIIRQWRIENKMPLGAPAELQYYSTPFVVYILNNPNAMVNYLEKVVSMYSLNICNEQGIRETIELETTIAGLCMQFNIPIYAYLQNLTSHRKGRSFRWSIRHWNRFLGRKEERRESVLIEAYKHSDISTKILTAGLFILFLAIFMGLAASPKYSLGGSLFLAIFCTIVTGVVAVLPIYIICKVPRLNKEYKSYQSQRQKKVDRWPY